MEDKSVEEIRHEIEAKSFPNPMRYQPLDALKKNSFVGEAWTETELRRYMHYWSRLVWCGRVPFKDFTYLKEE